MKNQSANYSQYKKNKSTKFKKVRHFIEWVIVKLLYCITSLLPLKWNQKIGKYVGSLAYYLANKDRGIALYQLEFCFPEKTIQEKKQIAKKSFQNVGQTLLETLSIPKFRKNIEKWITLENEHLVYSALKAGRGAIFVTAHYANWELFFLVYEKLNIKGKVIARGIHAKRLHHLLEQIRNSTHLEYANRGDANVAKLLLKCLRNNEIFILGLDQDTNVQSTFANFFGKPAKTPIVAANLAVKFETPVLFTAGKRNPDGTHHFIFEPLSSPPYDKSENSIQILTEKYNQAIESYIQKDPTQWVWFHRRWKTQPENIDS